MFKDYTEGLLKKLNQSEDKIEFNHILKTEFDSCSNYFIEKGHNLDIVKGFIGRQILNDKDLFIYQYYRDLHFIYWGLKGNWKTFDPIDTIYYDNLQRIVAATYDSKQ